MAIDHFDPRTKHDLVQDYDNLFPATTHCNLAKGSRWPSEEESRKGIRFLNCCEEQDYGEQMFEDANTHRLVGTTAAARWHIRQCDLNAPHLVRERELRARFRRLLESTPCAWQGQLGRHRPRVTFLLQALREEVDRMIPPIPPPPGAGS